MAASDARRPAVVGVAQTNQRGVAVELAAEPVELMKSVVAAAAVDAGSPGLLRHIDEIIVVQGAWSYTDPARLLQEHFGATKARTILTATGGTAPQLALNSVYERISAGEIQAAVIVGAETVATRRRARKQGGEFPTTRQGPDALPNGQIGQNYAMSSPFEERRGLTEPLHFYALFESAIRMDRGETIDANRDRCARLLWRFNQVAANNPASWSDQSFTVEEIRDAAPDNRMVAFPYTKRMCSNWHTDQAAAVIVCSLEFARRAGVPLERLVFPVASAEASEAQYVSNRRSLAHSPAMGRASARVFDRSGIDIDDVAHLDVYSCFASAVQIALDELGIADDRQLTVTGGLAYHGGPVANYVTHSTVAMVQTLRDDPQSYGFLTAPGGYLTTHAFCLYSGDPQVDRGFSVDRLGGPAEVEVHADEDFSGVATVEASVVLYDRSGPTTVVYACRTREGRRTWATSVDPATCAATTASETAGSAIHVAPSGEGQLIGSAPTIA